MWLREGASKRIRGSHERQHPMCFGGTHMFPAKNIPIPDNVDLESCFVIISRTLHQATVLMCSLLVVSTALVNSCVVSPSASRTSSYFSQVDPSPSN